MRNDKVREALKKARILIVDDHEPNVLLLQRILKRAGFTNLQSTTDARHALPLFIEFNPDLILLDLMMPHLDGFAVMKQVVSRTADGSFLPILVLTADASVEIRQQALSAGAKDFLTKPFDHTEAVLRISNLLHTRLLHSQIQNQKEFFEEALKERTEELEEAQTEILERLALAAEFRDDDTGEHTRRVGRLSGMVARRLGLPAARVELIERAAPLHDVGKIAIPDSILLKKGKLTPEEFETMKTHTTVGARMLSGGRSAFLHMAEEIALTHHEHWDGGGYSPGLKEEMIPLAGRIVTVVDVFDALTHDRVYRKAWPLEQVVDEIKCLRGLKFDPRVADAFLAALSNGGK